jgi:hypothetical protein
MTDAIRVHAGDKTDAEVRARHEEIEKRLEELGPDRVRMMMFHGGFPPQWDTIVHSWLTGDKLNAIIDKKNEEGDKS